MVALAMQLARPVPFAEAVEKLGDRSPVGSRMRSLEWSAVPLAIRERAMFSAGVESVRFLGRTKDALDYFLTGAVEQVTLPDGSISSALKVGSRDDFVAQMRRHAIEEGMGDLVDPQLRGTIQDITSRQRLALIFDTQMAAAQSYGDWVQGQDPTLLDEFPAQRFVRIQQVKEPRSSHLQYEGMVALKNNLAIWLRINADFGTPYGPWGWGCGHDVEDVPREEAESLGLLQPDEPVASAVRPFNDRLQASVEGLDDALLDLLRTYLGDSVEISGSSARLRQPPVPALP